MTLAEEFRTAQLAFCEELRESGDGYFPNRFEPRVRAGSGDDAVAYSARLIRDAPAEGTTGFRRMIQLGRGHQTLEYMVLMARWQALFDTPTLDAARWRLREHGVTAPQGE